ncbi:MAG: hypothetical protein U9Q05_07360 [Thermodesulfobacteriota bacterium]|nr:hypothetical protein [Thermodesulfobacteriota bacterium]
MAIPAKKKDPDFNTLKRELQRFQSERLNRTYADLMVDPRYAGLGDFFFNRLYAPKDFTFRDTSIKNLQHLLEGRIYRPMTAAMLKVIELHELTDNLDDRMVEKMVATGIGPKLTMDLYQAVYRQLNNYDQRVYQISLIVDVTRIFHGLSRKWVVAISLKTVTVAAHLLKSAKIIDFINEGYLAFRKVKRIDHFVDTITRREQAWHDKLWRGTKIDS